MLRRASRAIALVLPVFLLLAVGAAHSDEARRKKATALCREEFSKCQTGAIGLEANPFVEATFHGGCDDAKKDGWIDIPTWVKCSDWCEARRTVCLDQAASL